MGLRIIIATVGLLALAGPAAAQSMPLSDFVARANRIPLNAMAMLRPDAHRLRREGTAAMNAAAGRIRADRAAGRPPAACPPDRISVDPRRLLAHLNAIPSARRAAMTSTDGMLSWMAATWPCR